MGSFTESCCNLLFHDSGGAYFAAVLTQDYGRCRTCSINLKRPLGFEKLGEKCNFIFRKHLNFLLPGLLREELVAFACDREDRSADRQLVAADIPVEDRGINSCLPMAKPLLVTDCLWEGLLSAW
jgi:hypothetical protein